eukprot:g40523.t1
MDVEDDGEVDEEEEEEEPESQNVGETKEEMKETVNVQDDSDVNAVASIEKPVLLEDDASSLESIPGTWIFRDIYHAVTIAVDLGVQNTDIGLRKDV